MVKKLSGPKYEKTRRKEKSLQRDVLRDLKENGPRDYNVLYVDFDRHGAGDIAPALRDLFQWNYIERNASGDVSITEAGLRLLEDNNYWT